MGALSIKGSFASLLNTSARAASDFEVLSSEDVLAAAVYCSKAGSQHLFRSDHLDMDLPRRWRRCHPDQRERRGVWYLGQQLLVRIPGRWPETLGEQGQEPQAVGACAALVLTT